MNTLWYLDRAAGFVLLVLFTLSVVMGVLATKRTAPRWWSRLLSQDVHVRVTSVALALLVIHVATAVMDSYVDITPIDAVVPFLGGYRPFWLGLGTVVVDLVLIILISTFLRGRLSERAWRVFHVLAYAGWAMAVLHAWGTGTDARTAWGLTIIVLCTAAGLAALAVRLLDVRRERAAGPSHVLAGHHARRGEVVVR